MAQNTKQGMNGAVYAGNFIMQANAPLDDRSVVNLKSDLLRFNEYVYEGMLVTVLEDNEVYQLIDIRLKDQYEGWKRVGDDSGGVEELRRQLINSEKVISQALNLLNSLTIEHTNLLEEHQRLLDERINLYEIEVTDGEHKNVTITKNTHHCGNNPNITVYMNDEIVLGTVTVNSGDVTVSWGDLITPTVNNPIKIVIVGRYSE